MKLATKPGKLDLTIADQLVITEPFADNVRVQRYRKALQADGATTGDGVMNWYDNVSGYTLYVDTKNAIYRLRLPEVSLKMIYNAARAMRRIREDWKHLTFR